MKSLFLFFAVTACLSLASGKVFFEEKFDDSWQSRWVVSDWKKDDGSAGEWKHTAGKWYGDAEADKGIQTTPDARFYSISAKLAEEVDNKGKDLVLQFQVKHEQKIDCGGGYIKLIPGDIDQKLFGGDTEYSLMFGPDICGYSTKRVHAIITYKGTNLLTKKTVECKTDELSHVYTFIIKPDNTYQILIDQEEAASGSLYDDWDFLAPKQIKDPESKKPEDWVDDAEIDDPEDKKPAGWDDIPAEIVDPEASKPEDWDDEDDGEWEAPLIPNPEYKGEWVAKKIKNPAFKGRWEAPLIDNPEFEDDPEVYKLPVQKYVGMELWQVKAGTIFDNILVTDDVEYAKNFADETWGKTKDEEKKMFDEIKKKEDEEEEAKRKESESDLEKDDEEPEDDDAEGKEVELDDEPEETDESVDDEPGHDEL
eukprot:jgi/Mesen1/8132/ME000437S07228